MGTRMVGSRVGAGVADVAAGNGRAGEGADGEMAEVDAVDAERNEDEAAAMEAYIGTGWAVLITADVVE
jgi:hypothetical protein